MWGAFVAVIQIFENHENTAEVVYWVSLENLKITYNAAYSVKFNLLQCKQKITIILHFSLI